jgi:hypothetical protein
MIVLAAAAHLADLGTYLIMGEQFELNPMVPAVPLAFFAKLALIVFVSSIVMVLYAREKYPMVQWGLLQFFFVTGAFAASTNLVVILT